MRKPAFKIENACCCSVLLLFFVHLVTSMLNLSWFLSEQTLLDLNTILMFYLHFPGHKVVGQINVAGHDRKHNLAFPYRIGKLNPSLNI